MTVWIIPNRGGYEVRATVPVMSPIFDRYEDAKAFAFGVAGGLALRRHT